MGRIVLRLDRVMADRKMSLKEHSDRVGVSDVNLSKIKTGKISAIRFSTLENYLHKGNIRLRSSHRAAEILFWD